MAIGDGGSSLIHDQLECLGNQFVVDESLRGFQAILSLLELVLVPFP